MLKHLYWPVVFSLGLFCLLGCQKKVPSGLKNQKQLQKNTPNIAYVMSTYQAAWDTTINVVQFDLLLPIEIQDIKKGFFSTQLIKEYDQTPHMRYRLTGDISSDNRESMIKLHKVVEFQMQDGSWKTLPSDLKLEQQIVKKIYQRLQQ